MKLQIGSIDELMIMINKKVKLYHSLNGRDFTLDNARIMNTKLDTVFKLISDKNIFYYG